MKYLFLLISFFLCSCTVVTHRFGNRDIDRVYIQPIVSSDIDLEGIKRDFYSYTGIEIIWLPRKNLNQTFISYDFFGGKELGNIIEQEYQGYPILILNKIGYDYLLPRMAVFFPFGMTDKTRRGCLIEPWAGNQTIIHELGHVFNLFHTSSPTNIMFFSNSCLPQKFNTTDIKIIKDTIYKNKWHLPDQTKKEKVLNYKTTYNPWN